MAPEKRPEWAMFRNGPETVIARASEVTLVLAETLGETHWQASVVVGGQRYLTTPPLPMDGSDHAARTYTRRLIDALSRPGHHYCLPQATTGRPEEVKCK